MPLRHSFMAKHHPLRPSRLKSNTFVLDAVRNGSPLYPSSRTCSNEDFSLKCLKLSEMALEGWPLVEGRFESPYAKKCCEAILQLRSRTIHRGRTRVSRWRR